MKWHFLPIVFLLTAGHAAEKKAPDVKLPEKGGEDPLAFENLLDPGFPVPEILPAPETIPVPPSKSTEGRVGAKSELVSAANDYRRKTELFRKGKISRDALRTSAVRLAVAAKNYRSAVRR